MSNLIKDLAYCERPYEKAIEKGIDSLSDAELLAVIIKNGTQEESSIDLANKILNAHPIHKGILGLNYLQREDYLAIKGIGNTKATQLMSISALAGRINCSRLKMSICYDNPQTIAKYYMEKCKFLSKERVYLMLLSSSHMLIKEILISEGLVNQALISPRDIFIEALKHSAVRIILVHNHPSGIPNPSNDDICITKRIIEAGKLLDIRLSDHIIVGNGSYFSMAERGII